MLIYLQVIDAPEDRDQFITLYETYRGLMFYVANQILQNEQDAEDAVHDAFLSVAEHIKKFSRLERHKTKFCNVSLWATAISESAFIPTKRSPSSFLLIWHLSSNLASKSTVSPPHVNLRRCSAR